MDDSIPPRASGPSCSRTRLAESEVAAVDVCDCGLIHLHMGPFSLRLTRDSFQTLLMTLAQATGATVSRGPSARSTGLAMGQLPRGEA